MCMIKNEDLLIKRFSRDLEILDEIDEKQIAQTSDGEYRDILYLAKKLTEIDFSRGSKAREELKKRLMVIIDKNIWQQSELSHEELDYVAGGLKKDQDYPFRNNDQD